MSSVKKILSTGLVLLCCGLKVSAQVQPNPLTRLALTSVLPPAPNALELTRYSGLPVSLSSGSVSVSIPLGDIKSGKIDVPVSLEYHSGNGILVNQTASRTGMSWVLNAGGVITRTVYDSPDETAKWLTPPTSQMGGETTAIYNYLDSAATGGQANDTQVDIFSFNFNGFNGQFYLNPNDKTKVVFIDASNLKVETNFHNEFPGEDWAFRITDPKGTKYYFGGSNATETSKTNPTGSNCGRNYYLPVPGAWYLKAIQHYTGEYVWLTYLPCTFEYFSDVTETIRRKPAGTQYNSCGGTCDPISDDVTCFSNLLTTGMILKSINSRFQKVTFSYTGRTDISKDSLLSQVNFYSKGLADSSQLSLYNTYTLNYRVANNTSFFNPYSNSSLLSNRPFLIQVTRSAAGMQSQTHTMNYYNMDGLASRLSYAQDYWGYFNGVNNSNLVPANADPAIAAVFPSGLANKQPNASYSYFGLLSKITYPTKGADSLQYEANTIYEARNVAPPFTYKTISQTGTGFAGEKDTTYSFNLYNSQSVSLFIQCDSVGSGGTVDPLHQFATVSIITPGGTIEYSELFHPGDYNRSVSLPSGDHILKVAAQSDRIHCAATITYKTANFVYANYPVGGVRVAKNITDPITGIPLTKKYVYAALASQSHSSGKIRVHPSPNAYYSNQRIGTYCIGTGTGVGVCNYDIAYSTPLTTFNYFSGGHIYYSNVIELQDTLWTNGGTEHQFQFANPGHAATLFRGDTIPGSPIYNFDFPIGLENLRQTFVTTGNTSGSYNYIVVKKVATHYVSDPRKVVNQDNYVVRRNWPPQTIYDPPQTTMFEPYDLMGYTLESQWIYPDTVTTTMYDLNGLNPVTTYQKSVYANTENLLVTRTETRGSDGVIDSVTYSYPNNYPATAPYPAMVAANDIDHVIEQLYYKGGVLQEGIKTNYGDFGSGVYQPANIQTKTSGSYDTRINFYDYNPAGGLLSQSKANGPKNSYLWSYNNLLPVAEAKNAESNELYYENFEFKTTGVSAAAAHTGFLGCNSGFTVPFAPPDGKSYVITWFQKNGANWDYHRETYGGAGSKVFPSGVLIDDIAVYPADAQLSTVVFDPVAGPLGMIDIKGETATYQYDTYKRLTDIKDKDGNIVKHTDYHYAQ
ncbi:MAG TPA: hypothetical protein VHA56_14435 [Mucilaginibacter sp.]|nr:hypothetical protein [Mucilaginibacter sp.]